MRPASIIAAAGLVLAGCTSAPPGPGSTDLVDGSYQGQATLVTSNAPSCPEAAYGQIEVSDLTLHYAYTPSIIFAAPVQSDGTLHDEDGKYVLDGKLADNRLQFTVTTPDCQSTYNNTFIWNHS